MKKKFVLLMLVGCFFTITSCSQNIMRTLGDASKIKTKQQDYIGKTLNSLLSDIKVPILNVIVNQRKDSNEAPGHFFFQFNDLKQVDSIRAAGSYPVGIVVYIKEPFTWDYQPRHAAKNFSWTNEDTKRYGHLTIERLRVFSGKKDD